MTSLKYLKGVRTPYFNSLEREINNAATLLGAHEEVPKSTLLSDIQVCIEKIEKFISKLEHQSEKVIAATEDEDELVDTILREDSHICDSAMDLCGKLRKSEVSLKENIKHIESSEPPKDDSSTNVMEEIRKLWASQDKMEKGLKESKAKTAVKLPKLDIVTFSGDKLKWIEFWQSFESSVDKNGNLSNVDKFNYLRSKLIGEAKGAIAGLALSNENYEVATQILKDRFGNIQEMIDLHYNQMINLKPAAENVESLRHFTDTAEKHLRSLEVLRQDINQDVFVSVIKSKLPSNVIKHLEIQKGVREKWNVIKLQKLLKEYIQACEKAEKPKSEKTKPTWNRYGNQQRQYQNPYRNNSAYVKPYPTRSSAEALPINEGRLRKECRYCKMCHWSDECPTYRSINVRKERLKGSCFRCLKEGHMSKECKSKKSCVYCGQINLHHRSLCPQKFRRNETTETAGIIDEVQELSTPQSIHDENALLSSGEIVLMQTAKTKVVCPDSDKESNVRILLDSGSQRTYITENLATLLHLKRYSEQEIRVVTFGTEQSKVIKTVSTKLKIRLKNGNDLLISANIVPTITGTIYRKPVKVCEQDIFKSITQHLNLADTLPTEVETDTIQLLIGNDYYLDIILPHKLEVQPGLYLLSSQLGWILSGRTKDIDTNKNDTNMLIMSSGKIEQETVILLRENDEPNLEDFWKTESIGITDKPSQDDNSKALQMFKDTLSYKDQRYQVAWPWKDASPELPVNRQLAYGRLKNLVTKLKSKPELMKNYNCVIDDQLNKGVIEKVEKSQADGIRHYIPHHAVIKSSKTTTKLRIVHDASAQSSKEHKSLNDCLHRGPVFLQDLCGIMMRLRLNEIGIVADIEKAFLQVGLQINQRDVTRFLWLKNLEKPSLEPENIQEFRFCRVPFGVISSPFLLGATIDYHLATYNTKITEQLRNNIYMDNLVTGVDNVNHGTELYREAKSVFTEASMNLREWSTNNDDLMEIIPNEDKEEDETLSVLGHMWNRKNDSIAIKPVKCVIGESVTKRVILKQVASVYDPMGLFSPVTLRGKLLLQQMWIKHLDWDDTLNMEDLSLWNSVRRDLEDIHSYSVARCISIPNIETKKYSKYSLICFSDASSKAYSSVIYMVQSDGVINKSELIFSKSRLAPVKKLTIPRLELLAVLIGVRCLRFVQDQLRLPIHKKYLFTDSKCVLQWITSKNQLPVFVQNRVNEIRLLENTDFQYIETNRNPADVGSRGCTSSKLFTDQLWWHGPDWLIKPEEQWEVPLTTSDSLEVESNECVETESMGNVFATEKSEIKQCLVFPKSPPFDICCERFSSM